MSLNFTNKRPKKTIAHLVLGGSLFILSGFLLVDHIQVMNEVKTVSVPLVAKLSDLERRESALKEQIELSQIHDALRVGSIGEKLDAYVLPKETDFDRLIAVMDLFADNLREQGILAKMSEITFGDLKEVNESSVRMRPMHVSFALHEKGVEKVMKLIRIAGLLTVGDALTDQELEALLKITEEENPAGVVALEQFLSLDLVRYARDVKSHETQLKKSFTSTAFADTLQKITRKSLLKDVRSLLEGDFGKYVLESDLWPIQFMTLSEARGTEGGAEDWYMVRLEVLVWERI